MNQPERPYFQLQQAREIASAFAEHNVEFLFIGKGGAIILGYPAATQDVDIFPRKSAENGRRIIDALNELGFNIDEANAEKIIRGADFVQLNEGPFDVDLVFAPDGIETFNDAHSRRVVVDGLPVANIRDIIASKKAAGRQKDLIELPLLEDFREEYEKSVRNDPKSAIEIALERLNTTNAD